MGSDVEKYVMKKLLLILMLIVSTSAMAEWVAIATADGIISYANPATIRKSGNKVKMWSLIDFNSVQEDAGDKFLSSKSQNEYDCKEERIRTLYFSWHSENMGGGDVVYIDRKPDKNWDPVMPESTGENLWKIACGK